MSEGTTAAMWATDMAELTGCDQTIWVQMDSALPEAEPVGKPMPLQYPDGAQRESLELLLRGGMAGYAMYAVPLAPGVEAPWVQRGLLLTDDPGTARWFAALPGAAQGDALGNSDAFLRVLHLSHCHGEALAAIPETHTLWALGADIGSMCRAISLGLGSYEGRWGDWLTVPLTVQENVGVLSAAGTPHWLQIGQDGKLWAGDPWAAEPPVQGLDALVVAMPELTDGLCRTDWPTMVLCAAMALWTPEHGVFGLEHWYYDGIVKYLNQWAHTEDIVPRPPQSYVGNPAAWPPAGGELTPCLLGQRGKEEPLQLAALRERVARLKPVLANPANGLLCPYMAACWEYLTKD